MSIQTKGTTVLVKTDLRKLNRFSFCLTLQIWYQGTSRSFLIIFIIVRISKSAFFFFKNTKCKEDVIQEQLCGKSVLVHCMCSMLKHSNTNFWDMSCSTSKDSNSFDYTKISNKIGKQISGLSNTIQKQLPNTNCD